jgi:hypothetical protein
MVKIASHHTWKESGYQPRHDWPGDTLVQWGGHGVVLGRNPYTTAFFEAFPDKEITTSGGFIRGEGKTIEEAEDDAFAKFGRQSSCSHLWGREHYRNSGQLCRHCRAFRCGHVKPIVELGSWRKPVDWSETWFMSDDSDYGRVLRIRARLFGVTERPDRKPETGTAAEHSPAQHSHGAD